MLAQEDKISRPEPSARSGDIFASVEMSRSKWVIGLHTPLSDKIALHTMTCGDVDAVLALVERQRKKLVAAESGTSRVIICYEAGYEGFWLQRRLDMLGIRVVIIDPASLLVDRRAKRAKTDRIDARALLRALMAYTRGESQVLSEVRVPTVEQDDARRLLRERQRLVQERTAHTNRIKGLLKTQGIMDFDPRAADAVARLDAIVTGDGRSLGACLKREIARELERARTVALVERFGVARPGNHQGRATHAARPDAADDLALADLAARERFGTVVPPADHRGERSDATGHGGGARPQVARRALALRHDWHGSTGGRGDLRRQGGLTFEFPARRGP